MRYILWIIRVWKWDISPHTAYVGSFPSSLFLISLSFYLDRKTQRASRLNPSVLGGVCERDIARESEGNWTFLVTINRLHWIPRTLVFKGHGSTRLTTPIRYIHPKKKKEYRFLDATFAEIRKIILISTWEFFATLVFHPSVGMKNWISKPPLILLCFVSLFNRIFTGFFFFLS